ncbi:hypothetical protein [Stackebrandtia soli]|uniref:hypothetical protein n=1 Tax=Stackebrandtia soli TaxID=1892856 RepID=UPI0039EA11CE
MRDSLDHRAIAPPATRQMSVVEYRARDLSGAEVEIRDRLDRAYLTGVGDMPVSRR